MRVDQARHHNPPAAIDHSCAFRRGHVAGGNPLDTIALDKQVKPPA
jgi:hypothetical protein